MFETTRECCQCCGKTRRTSKQFCQTIFYIWEKYKKWRKKPTSFFDMWAILQEKWEKLSHKSMFDNFFATFFCTTYNFSIHQRVFSLAPKNISMCARVNPIKDILSLKNTMHPEFVAGSNTIIPIELTQHQRLEDKFGLF